MVNYYLYKITYQNKQIVTHGIIAAKSYTEAMQTIINDYGNDSICKIKYLTFSTPISSSYNNNESDSKNGNF